VTVRGLRVVRGGTPILDGLDLDIPAGLTGLLGPSGCGKTTLMRAIVGVQVVAGGEVSVLGRPAGSPALRSQVGYVTQAPAVYGDLTVRENLDYFARILDVGASRIDETLATVGLERLAGRAVHALSGGERARTNLAAALLNRPRVLVLDEPTVGLDPILRRDLWRTFARLAAGGTALIVSSHVMDEAARCEHLLLMRAGRIIASGSLEALLRETGTGDVESAFMRLVERSGEAS
jgi:ABC-2 type transport system ATP-binding protein